MFTKLLPFIMLLLCGIAYSAEKADKFPIADVSVEEMLSMHHVMGQITNNSGKDYQMASFKLSFFDENKKLIGFIDFMITDFEQGDTMTFDGISQRDISKWKSYRVQLDSRM